MTGTQAEVIVQQASDFTEWDQFVAASPESTFCHQAGWRTIMTGLFGHECQYLTVRDAGGIRGALPLVRVRTPLGHYLVSMPFVNDGGPLGDADAKAALVSHALTLAKSSGAGLLELRSRTPVDGTLDVSFRKVAVHLPLPASVAELWEKTFKAKLRSQIRRPTKEGMTARVGADQLDAFYRVFSRNMRDLGTPVLPRAFFEQLAAQFGERVMYVSVWSATGLPVAAACCLQWREEVEVTWASSLREYNHLSPNMLLYATMMEQSIARGAHIFNFGRCSPGAATHKFKLQWGGYDVPLPWAYWSRNQDHGTPSADSPAFKLAISVWQRMPLMIANRLGPMVARGLP